MTILNDNLGGTDIYDGQIPSGADWMDTIRSGIIIANQSATDTAEYNYAMTDNNWHDLSYTKTFTVPNVGANNIILGMKLVASVKGSSAETRFYRIKLTNNTTSKSTYLYNDIYTDAGSDADGGENMIHHSSATYSTYTSYASTQQLESNKYAWMSSSSDTYSNIWATPNNFDAYAFGSTYTITLEVKKMAGAANHTGYIKDITLTAYWTAIEDAVVSGWA